MAFLIILGLVALIVGSYILDRKSSKEEIAKLEKEIDDWLKEQETVPNYSIHVRTKSCFSYNSDPIKPQASIEAWINGPYVEKITSLDRANCAIERCMGRGYYFHEKQNIFVPLHEIDCMQARNDLG